MWELYNIICSYELQWTSAGIKLCTGNKGRYHHDKHKAYVNRFVYKGLGCVIALPLIRWKLESPGQYCVTKSWNVKLSVWLLSHVSQLMNWSHNHDNRAQRLTASIWLIAWACCDILCEIHRSVVPVRISPQADWCTRSESKCNIWLDSFWFRITHPQLVDTMWRSEAGKVQFMAELLSWRTSLRIWTPLKADL